MGLSSGKQPPLGPDYSDIDSREKVERLVAAGELVPLLLLPKRFGGDERRENMVFVPPFAAELKASTDEDVILPLAQAGKITQYSAVPQYAGRSFVPIAIRLLATDPSNFTYEVRIWGEAPDRAR